ncbi:MULTISPECIES: hypothetical protein [unclassified Caulobacter]|jgi:hypothetical protein|uniref:hypothetical protein n=1 Tax=unclassified Caulobacter TaxID=2648921 RepID=UPI001E46D84B|nr:MULTISPECIES: hypothetical protein [unclassified Caulobacter]
MTWVGVGAVKPVDRIRVPVTTTSETELALSEGVWTDWAWTDPAAMTVANALVASKALKKADPPRVLPTALILKTSQISR